MTDDVDKMTLGELLEPYASRCREYLLAHVLEAGVPERLAQAVRYCVMNGGKRLRPALVMMAAEMGSGGETDLTARAAVAVELVHCYSLVHDDLPAMDDDTLRRGQPTAHVKFGEAMAILTGDAMLTRAFGVLAESGHHRGGELVCELARAAGPAGMIAGQTADMKLCEVPDGIEGVEYIHLRKTAGLLRASTRMGAICGDMEARQIASLGEYGQAVGMAFQLFDDLLDATGDAETLGKTPGKDAGAGKHTAVGQLGIAGARKFGGELTARAIATLDGFAAGAGKLVRLAQLLANRTN